MFLSTLNVSVLAFLYPVSIADLQTSSLGLTVSQVGCLNTQLKYQPSPPLSPTLPTSSKITLLSHACDSTVGGDNYILPFEHAYFCNSIANDPPPLFQHSNLMQCPFPCHCAIFFTLFAHFSTYSTHSFYSFSHTHKDEMRFKTHSIGL